MTATLPRHETLRRRAFALRVTNKQIAEDTGYHREYVSQILLGKARSQPALDKIEELLDREEQGRPA